MTLFVNHTRMISIEERRDGRSFSTYVAFPLGSFFLKGDKKEIA
jgi:hypothetical protein